MISSNPSCLIRTLRVFSRQKTSPARNTGTAWAGLRGSGYCPSILKKPQPRELGATESRTIVCPSFVSTLEAISNAPSRYRCIFGTRLAGSNWRASALSISPVGSPVPSTPITMCPPLTCIAPTSLASSTSSRLEDRSSLRLKSRSSYSAARTNSAPKRSAVTTPSAGGTGDGREIGMSRE